VRTELGNLKSRAAGYSEYLSAELKDDDRLILARDARLFRSEDR
jgi:hypothetical protein